MPYAATKNFLQTRLAASPGVKGLLLGFSGGLDSTVLLHVLAQLAPAMGFRLRALHVHHGLSPNADAWAEHAGKVCAELAVPLHIERVVVAGGASVEAEARRARHAAFAACLQKDEALLLAQHRDDQAETVLFRLLRGAGVTGLGAMSAVTAFPVSAGVTQPQWRPLLTVSRADIEACAHLQGMEWIEDESNDDTRFARNFLRRDIIPLLQTRWPAVTETLAATALRLQEADALLTELAVELAQESVDARQRLDVVGLKGLTLAQQRLLLRHWLRTQGFLLPDEALLELILGEVLAAREDAEPVVAWSGVEVRRYREHLFAMPPLPSMPQGWEREWDGVAPLALPDGRVLTLLSAPGNFTVRYRRGGERLRPAGLAQSRELKTLFQENAVPPWERERLPLVWRGEELLAVAGMSWGRSENAPLLKLETLG
jgi:tRNA(Ile)-lysidine synthase